MSVLQYVFCVQNNGLSKLSGKYFYLIEVFLLRNLFIAIKDLTEYKTVQNILVKMIYCFVNCY